MKLINFLLTAFLAHLSVSSSVAKRVFTPVVDDGIILNYALTIEYVQLAFFRNALDHLGRSDFQEAGYPDPFYDNLLEIYLDELKLITVLNDALLATTILPTVELRYSFPAVSAQSCVSLASVFAGFVTSAMLGATPSIVDKDYLTIIGSITGTEARHVSYLRASLGESPFTGPFETPLDFNQAYSIAVSFITQDALAQSPVRLPFQAFPTLTLACSDYYYEAGRSSLTFANAFQNAVNQGLNVSTAVFAVFLSGIQKLPVEVRTTSGSLDYKLDQIPSAVIGQSYVMLSISDEDFSDPNILAGPAILEVYPKGQIPATPRASCN